MLFYSENSFKSYTIDVIQGNKLFKVNYLIFYSLSFNLISNSYAENANLLSYVILNIIPKYSDNNITYNSFNSSLVNLLKQ